MAGPQLSMRRTYQHLRMVVLSVGFGVAVWFGAGWLLVGLSDPLGGSRPTIEAPGSDPAQAAPPVIRNKLREDEQIHRIYFCTARPRHGPDADPMERSWACVAISGGG